MGHREEEKAETHTSTMLDFFGGYSGAKNGTQDRTAGGSRAGDARRRTKVPDILDPEKGNLFGRHQRLIQYESCTRELRDFDRQ